MLFLQASGLIVQGCQRQQNMDARLQASHSAAFRLANFDNANLA
jgi:hypothetical protein